MNNYKHFNDFTLLRKSCN